jgi:Mg2+ and Co2+ transporter CorA
VLDDVCDEYIPVVETLEREGDVIDVQVLMKDANDQPHMIE